MSATRWRPGGRAASKEMMSGRAPWVGILTWLLQLTPGMTTLSRGAAREAAMACGATPPSCPSLGTVPVNHRLSAHGDVLPRPNGFEALQTDLHGTSGTHEEYNHGRVQSLRTADIPDQYGLLL